MQWPMVKVPMAYGLPIVGSQVENQWLVRRLTQPSILRRSMSVNIRILLLLILSLLLLFVGVVVIVIIL